jgi:hypothetical protein
MIIQSMAAANGGSSGPLLTDPLLDNAESRAMGIGLADRESGIFNTL